jgi:Holliday junction resolvase RusA-like endonuclease
MTEDTDIQDFSATRWPRHTQCACNPGCMSCSPSCRSSGPDRPFALPADSVEITLDLPMPVSTNKIWRTGRGRTYRSKEYVLWCERADMAVMVTKKPGPLPKIYGLFEVEIRLSSAGRKGRDGDNYCKSVLDFCQSRDIVRNDSDCRRGSWAWVEPERAPKGVRVILKSLHG